MISFTFSNIVLCFIITTFILQTIDNNWLKTFMVNTHTFGCHYLVEIHVDYNEYRLYVLQKLHSRHNDEDLQLQLSACFKALV